MSNHLRHGLRYFHFVVLSLGLFAGACETGEEGGGGGNRSCEALCEEAQEFSCTTIQGNCSSFCEALDNSRDAAGCGAEYDDYLSCENASANVCDEPGCSSEEADLNSCYATYCLTNPGDEDCATLLSSF